MKAKGIKKLLMRGCHHSFWGHRAYVTARIPLANLGVPACPPRVPTEIGKSAGWEGSFERQEGELTVFTMINEMSSSTPPSDSERLISDVDHTQYELADFDDDGNIIGEKTYHTYTWYEMRVRVHRGNEFVEERPGDIEILKTYVARHKWQRKYMQGLTGPTEIPVLDYFLWAANEAKTTYPFLDEKTNTLYITYSVKWRYPERKRGFCRDLAAAMRFAKVHGVNAKVLKS